MIRRASLTLTLALACVPCPAARADDARAGDGAASAPLLVRVARSAAARHREHVDERARSLARLLRALPGVVDATCALTLDDVASAPLDRPLAPPRAAVVLRVRGQGPDDQAVRALAQSVVRDLSAEGVTIHRHRVEAEAAPPLVRVGPLEVAATSAALLRAVLALSLASNALLAGLVLWRARPHRPRGPFVDRWGRRGPRA